MFELSKSKRGPFETWIVKNAAEDSLFEIAPARGGILLRARARGRELLYLDEATFLDTTKNVRGGIPVCFPIAGKIEGNRAVFEGTEIQCSQHGFARNSVWAFEHFDAESGKLTISLSSNDATRAVYPFEFIFKITYRILDDSLGVETEIVNIGARTMPLHFGFHPYFYIGETEKNLCKLIASATRAFNNRTGEFVAFKAPSFGGEEVDYHILNPNGGAVRLRRADGSGLRLDYGGFPCAVIWTLPGKDFICLEPWTAPAGALQTGAGLIKLLPGETDWRMWFVQIEDKPSVHPPL